MELRQILRVTVDAAPRGIVDAARIGDIASLTGEATSAAASTFDKSCGSGAVGADHVVVLPDLFTVMPTGGVESDVIPLSSDEVGGVVVFTVVPLDVSAGE
jgi:hypothetical protein